MSVFEGLLFRKRTLERSVAFKVLLEWSGISMSEKNIVCTRTLLYDFIMLSYTVVFWVYEDNSILLPSMGEMKVILEYFN